MKLNWGSGIAIFYTLFVSVLVFQVIRTTQVDHSLVSDNYYELDLQYQKRYDQLNNSQNLENNIEFNHDKAAKKLSLQFPNIEAFPSGKIHFFRPSNSGLDFKVKIQTDQSRRMQFPTDKLAPGLWRIKVDWESDDQTFYQEAVVVI